METQDNIRDEGTGSTTSITGNETQPQPNSGMIFNVILQSFE